MYHPDGDFDNWGGYEWEGSGIICEISVPSAQFCCEPTTALKYKGYKGSWSVNQLIQLLHRWFSLLYLLDYLFRKLLFLS